jgi:hypothetical protein
MLRGEQARADADRQQMETARAERRDALEEEVRSLRMAANDVRIGAVVSASLTVSGAGLQAASALQSGTAATSKAGEAGAARAPVLDPIGAALPRLSEPAYAFLANEKGHAADQAAARLSAEEADRRADDAQNHRARIETWSDRLLEATQQTLSSNASARLSLINRI